MSSTPKGTTPQAVFDRRILLHHAMNDEALAKEVLGLFLQQIETLASKDWGKLDLNFEMHTLKGSAATVGAMELEELARNWREIGSALQTRVKVAIAAFEQATR